MRTPEEERMTGLYEAVERMRAVIGSQADLIALLFSMVEQASLTGPGVDDATARAAAISEEIKAIDSAVGGEIGRELPPLPDSPARAATAEAEAGSEAGEERTAEKEAGYVRDD